jgi:hypothetical protein
MLSFLYKNCNYCLCRFTYLQSGRPDSDKGGQVVTTTYYVHITYTSWRVTPDWFSYSHYRAFVCPIGERIHVYYQCLP